MLNKMVTFENKSDAQCTHNLDYIEGLSDVEHPHYKENVNDIKVGKTIYIG